MVTLVVGFVMRFYLLMMLPCVFCVACMSGRGLGSDESGKASLPEEMAVMATSEGILMVPRSGAEVKVLAPDAARWCKVDTHSQVVWWMVEDEGKNTLTLRALDMTEDSPVARDVVRGLPDIDVMVIDYPGDDLLGDIDGVDFQVGARLNLGAKPGIESYLGCDGDQSWYCYDNPGGEADMSKFPLLPEVQRRMDAVKTSTVVDMEFLQELSSRQSLVMMFVNKVVGKTARVEVSKGECDEPEDCGEARPVNGSDLWLVRVASSRGDFYYELLQFYDPDMKIFVDLLHPEQSSPKPLPEQGIGEFFVSASGDGLAMGGAVVSLSRGPVFVRDSALACGWLSGGWHESGKF